MPDPLKQSADASQVDVALPTEPRFWWVRTGCLGDLVPARWSVNVAGELLSRGQQVLVRTSRGVEMAEVGREIEPNSDAAETRRASVTILRRTTANDQRLIDRLSQHRVEAVEACRDAIAETGSDAVLLDVDHLFDGGTLLLHFLGSVPSNVDEITGAIIARYESIVRTSEFAALLESGCGPGCGTSDSMGCGSGGGCVSCALQGSCSTT